MTRPIRLVFLGTAELACRSLVALADSPDVEVVGVISQPDKAKGRQMRLVPTAVKATALEYSLPVWQPERLRKDTALIEHLKNLSLDLMVVAAYGQILPSAVLEAPKHGCVNVHTSLLPKYRGAAPIQWAILNGDSETGITLMQMDEGLDTGDIIAQKRTAILTGETGGELHDRLAELGASFLVETIPQLVAGKLSPQAQQESEATHARKLTKSDSQIDWSQPANVIHNQIRGLNPWPGTSGRLQRGNDNRLIKLWSSSLGQSQDGAAPGTVIDVTSSGIEIACGSGSVIATCLQREGAKRLEAKAFLSGFPIQKGDTFICQTSEETSP